MDGCCEWCVLCCSGLRSWSWWRREGSGMTESDRIPKDAGHDFYIRSLQRVPPPILLRVP